MTAWILLGVALLLIVACGVFVAAEFAFVTVDRSQVDQAIAELVDGPLEALGTPTGAVHPVAIGFALALGATLTMIFGELVPKNLAIARPRETAAPPSASSGPSQPPSGYRSGC